MSIEHKEHVEGARAGGATRRIAAGFLGGLMALTASTLAIPPASAGTDRSVADADQQTSQQRGGQSAQQVHRAFMALPEVQEALAASPGQRSGQTKAAPATLAKTFAGHVVAGLLQGGGREAFDSALRAMGYNPGDSGEVAAALSDVQKSLDQLEAQNRQIIDAIEDLHNEVMKANFKKANADVVRSSNNIADILGVIQYWVAHDITPQQSTVTAAVYDLRTQVTELRGAASDSESGAVPLLLLAYDRNVSNGEQLWEAVSDYRDQVRVALAQGIGGLELVLNHWAASNGEYDAFYEVARTSTLATVDAMYGYGVQPYAPENRPYVQLQGGAALTRHTADIPARDAWLWRNIDVTAANMEPILKELAQRYRPGKHDGMTLEQFLKENGIPTSYVYPDTWTYRTTYEYITVFKTRRNVYYTPEVRLGQIVGNEYRSPVLVFGDRVQAGSQDERCTLPWIGCRWEWLNGPWASADSSINRQVSEWRKASQGLASERSEQWQRESGRHGDARAHITASRNGHNGLGGWLADTRPESVREAAYGTGG